MIKKNLEEYKGTAIYAQQVDGKLSPIALELLGKARALANDLDDKTVTAVLIGYQVGGLVDELAAYGADKVVVIDDPELKDYRTEPYTQALAGYINEFKLRIGTVDSFQGMEFDVVFLSLVRTGKSGFGFLKLYNRLNVSMSRQKKLLVAVGDAAFYNTDQAREQVPGLADFLKVCRNQGRVL